MQQDSSLESALGRLTAVWAAPRLIGSIIRRQTPAGQIAVRIIETESYFEDDPASHSFAGPTPRTSVMFGPAGRAYVYFTYGMHHCFNVVVGRTARGEAVLVRAVEPINGTKLLQQNRPLPAGRRHQELSNGPAKLCQALGIDRQLNGHNLAHLPLKLELQPPLGSGQIAKRPRIGISQAKHELLRFYEKDNPWISAP